MFASWLFSTIVLTNNSQTMETKSNFLSFESLCQLELKWYLIKSFSLLMVSFAVWSNTFCWFCWDYFCLSHKTFLPFPSLLPISVVSLLCAQRPGLPFLSLCFFSLSFSFSRSDITAATLLVCLMRWRCSSKFNMHQCKLIVLSRRFSWRCAILFFTPSLCNF